jgi:hypothetical protein
MAARRPLRPFDGRVSAIVEAAGRKATQMATGGQGKLF